MTGCYNCRNTLPTLKRWDARYRERELAIIGVHTPESDDERNVDNVAVREQGDGLMVAVSLES